MLMPIPLKKPIHVDANSWAHHYSLPLSPVPSTNW